MTLGYASPGRMLADMTGEEWDQWQRYAELEPFGPLQEAGQAGVIAAAVCAPWTKKPPKPSDFFPQLAGKDKGWVTGEDMVKVAQMMTLAMGGEVK